MREQKRKKAAMISIALAVLMTALLSLTACQKKDALRGEDKMVKKSTDSTKLKEPGTDLGGFTSKTIYGTEVKTGDMFAQSELTVVNIWNPSCTSCESEMEALGNIARAYTGKGVQILGIIQGVQTERDAGALAMSKKTGTDYVHILDTDELEAELIGSYKELPVTILVDKNGIQQGDVYAGAKDEKEWQEIIEEHHNAVCTGNHPAESGVG